jgi:hypothetical protein
MKFLLLMLGALGTWTPSPHSTLAQPAGFGSLIKPFTALAYAARHGYRYPERVCTGCWLPRGHGRVGIREAVAHSCNSYFESLVAEVRPEEVVAVLERFGISGLTPGVPAGTLTGKGQAWRIRPQQMARAYLELFARAGEPGVGELLEGMRLSSSEGTGRGLELPALVKTGTGPCFHAAHAPGDGYAIVLYPAAQPRAALLLEAHGVPGSQAALAAGKLLRAELGLP